MKNCDVIVPIYNAYDYVIKCVDSLIANTSFDGNKIILIDDQSPDKRIWPLIKEYAKKYEFIEAYQNRENKGFVATVNRGMEISKNDVVLLNSDTEVTKNWLIKMQECAYSKPKVATVTPLSNNATLASVPKCFEPNDIPEGYTLEKMGELVENCSKKIFPEIPTGHGFCLYIKRDVLDEVGLFDAETYGKGYGEENDFCFRCFDHGYRHLLCDNTYIYHKESQSFSSSKIELQKNAGKLLRKRYPMYCDKLDYWCQTKPLKYIVDNVALALGTAKKRNNILCVIHDWNISHLGGTTMHLFDIIKELRKNSNFHVFTFDNGVYKLYSYWENEETVVSYPASQEFHFYRYYNDEYRRIVERIIKQYNISTIHIHHMMNHYFDLVDIIEKYKIKTVLSIHDYFSVCPLVTKLYQNKYYCGNFEVNKCNNCLKATVGLDGNSINNWHFEWVRLFKVCDDIICPSESCKNEILKVYPDLKIEVIEHGIEYPKRKEKYVPSINDKTVNVAFVGAIGLHKGRDILLNLIKNNRNKKVKYHLFGVFDGVLPKNNKYFENHGPYDRKDLQKKLIKNNISVVCLLSICPETFSYTLSEVSLCGIPVITFDIGALAERTKKNNLGWVLPLNSDYKVIASHINYLINNSTEYDLVQKCVDNYHIKTIEEMASEYEEIYKGFYMIKYFTDDQKDDILNDIKNSNTIVPVNAIYNYAWVFDTLKWKIISKFKLPKFVKNIYHKVKK